MKRYETKCFAVIELGFTVAISSCNERGFKFFDLGTNSRLWSDCSRIIVKEVEVDG